MPGFCKSTTLEEVRKHDHVLTPGRYVGMEIKEEDDEPFNGKISSLINQWKEQQVETERLDKEINKVLTRLNFE